jgi:hypothetical protein
VATGAKDLEIVTAITGGSGQVDTLAADCDEPSGSTTLRRPRLYGQGISSAACPPCSWIPTGSTPVGIISDHAIPGPGATPLRPPPGKFSLLLLLKCRPDAESPGPQILPSHLLSHLRTAWVAMVRPRLMLLYKCLSPCGMSP